MDLWKSLNGMVQMEMICADPGTAITQINHTGITLHHADRAEEDIITRFYVRRQDVKKLKQLAEKRGYELLLFREVGIYWIIRRLIKRPILTVGVLLFLFLAMFLPTRVFFFEIEGNTTIPSRLILEKCQQCGISFGASRREIRSEKMKNALLEAIPQLQWAGINTYGCRAVISVGDRTQAEQPQTDNGVCSIVATRDGVITQCTATRGNLICRTGQAVKAGEVLISGYTDCGIAIQATRAQGEIYAATNRSVTAVLPEKWQSQASKTATEKKYSVIIGKKRINFYKGSGISDASCDKMYSESYVTLPGGFQLPVIFVTETLIFSDETGVTLSQPDLSGFADRYLQQQMVGGTVVSCQEDIWTEDGLYKYQGNYACTEMIGQVRNEEIIKPYEQHD